MLVVQEDVQDSLYKPARAAMFTAGHRLLREDGFGRVLQAKNISNRFFKIFFAQNDKSNARLGIVSAKRILPKAADRNRVKRVIREAFRQHSIKACKMDVVVMVRPAYAQERPERNDNLLLLLGQVESRCAEL